MHPPIAGLSLLHPVSPTARVCTYVPASHLHGGVAINVGQQAQAEALRVGRICESIHSEGRLRGVEGLPDPLVQLIVSYGAPESRLGVGHWLQVYNKNTQMCVRSYHICLVMKKTITKCGTKHGVSH